MNNLLKIVGLAFFLSLTFFACKEQETLPDPVLPILKIESIDVEEADSDVTLSFVVKLEGQNNTNVVVSYTTVERTATSGLDYDGRIGELVFAPDENEKIVEINIKGDLLKENTETFDFILLNPINATMVENSATISIIDNDELYSSFLSIPTEGYTTPLSYSGMTLVWSDEFDQSELDDSAWTHETGNGNNGWGNNELQYYQSDNTFMAGNDYLVIQAIEEEVNGFNYTSSRIITAGKKEFQYGRIDIRAVMPKGRGMWPALWMLGSNFYTEGWPACGEIDIMELLGHINNIVHGTVHFGNNPSEHASVGASRITPSGTTFDEAFHVFSLLWEEDHIRILVDDNLYVDVEPADLNGQPWPFNDEFFFIFNIAVGGNWPGSPDENTVFPQFMIVDYVRVFQ